MMFKLIISKTIIYGSLLAVIVIGVFLFYPELVSHFYRQQQVSAFILDKKELVQPHIERISERIDKIKASIDAPIVIKDKSIPVVNKGLKKEPQVPVVTQVPVMPYNRDREKTSALLIPYFEKEEKHWQKITKREISPDNISTYPYHECFQTNASKNNLPLHVVFGIAAYLSNFDPKASLKNKFGIMHLAWPNSEITSVKSKKAIKYDPCQNIEFGCRFLSQLLEQSNGEWVPAIIAYKKQSTLVRREKVTKEDLIFSRQLRKRVEGALMNAYTTSLMTPLIEFDSLEIAERFLSVILEKAEFEFWLDQKNYKYTIYFPAKSELEKETRKKLISKMTGIDTNLYFKNKHLK
jgi:hypothetical protein